MPMGPVRRLSRASVTGVVLLLTLGLAATGTSSASPSVGTAKTAGDTPTPNALVHQVALVTADFTDGSTVEKVYRGDKVGHQVTLDYCGFNFTTETRRVARHQTIILPASPGRVFPFLSNEVVAYQSPHFAGKALRQLRKAVTNCPKDVFIPEKVAGAPDLRYDKSTVHTSAKLPIADNAVVKAKVTIGGPGGRHGWAVWVFQRHGTVLDGIYRQSRKKPTAAKIAALQALATITGNRLAAT
jgi:hypothetical protein